MAPSENAGPMKGPSFQILLVADESVVRTWGESLAEVGYRVELVSSGGRALHRLEADPVDLVVLAADLPDMTGLACLGDVRRLHSHAKLPVIVAADMESKDVVKAFDAGANDVVPIPIDFSVLLARIQASLRGRRPVAASAPGSEDGSWDDPEPGTVLAGKYEIGARLGGGHFGRVYRARHLTLKRDVAVKVLHPRNQNREEILERFRREGMSACQMDHPNAVTVLDYSVTESGLPFLVMELLEGRPLNLEIRDQGTLTPLRTSVIVLPVCEVLAEAHSLGIIHRDVKPHNIFLHQARRGEVVKVLDFGIAKLMGGTFQGQELTVEGSGPGTPTYMAPERFSEEPCDGRADVYSLGVTMYEMLTGTPPFHTPTGNPIKLALMHMNEEPAPLCEQLPDLPRPIERVVMRALEKDAARRPDAAELARELVAALGLELPASYDQAPGTS